MSPVSPEAPVVPFLSPRAALRAVPAPPRQVNAVPGGSVLLADPKEVPRCPQVSPGCPQVSPGVPRYLQGVPRSLQGVPRCPQVSPNAVSVPELLFGQSRAPPRQVNAVLGGSVLLAPSLPPNQTVKEIEWSFSGGSGATIQVAEVGPGGFERPDPRDRFGRRLEMFNATALRIRELQRGDSGVFGARIKMQPALVDDQSFNLSVYESVPSPRTRSQLLASTLEWCNLTLQCQGSGSGAVNVTWQRDSLTWGQLGTARHQLSPDGTTLRVALPPAATNVTYACTVSNPADRKVALFDLQSLCQGGGGPSAFSTSGYVVLSLILVAVSLGGAFWCWRANSEKASEAAATPAAPAEESPGEAQYSDIVCRSPPEGNDQGPSPAEAPQEPSEPQKPETPAPKSSPGGDEQGQRPPEDTAEEVT
ncbi:T-lymphocyte surface antigen Ly-9-like isoform X3 [Hirundo rustica]|uniref:T-lymphocyte surface antigen Ly-9-like isoform X3 n=1 Tax=Hirundo rustica TaxID=43150 RepID=UPI001A940083|nr:T-lymphocyte surface antigen Ly-9-like isoform X3 [Hirundo rustica]